MKSIQILWENWNDICSFVPKEQFVVGTFIDDKGNACDDAHYNILGLKLHINNQIRLAKQGDYLVKENSKCSIMSKEMFILKKKLDKVWNL